MAFNYSPKPVIDSSLVLYLDAANPRSYVSGSSVWTDVSRGGNTGALTNGPTYSSANGGSIVFDGSNDYVSVPATNTISSAFTISTWMKNNGGTNKEIACKYSTATPSLRQFEFWVEGAGQVSIYAYGSGVAGWRTSTKIINDNKIYNIVGVFSGANSLLNIYINSIIDNGALNGTVPSSVNISSQNIEIGRYDGGGYFNGNISNVSIYNRALSATEVRQNYNALKGRYGLR